MLYIYKFSIERNGQSVNLIGEFEITNGERGYMYDKNGLGYPGIEPECFLEFIKDSKTNQKWDGELTAQEILNIEMVAYKDAISTDFGKY